MRVLGTSNRGEVATVHIADLGQNRLVEFVESTQPPATRAQKWVLIVSVLYGCPVRCLMCDAGGDFKGRLDKEEMFSQIDYLIRSRYPDGRVPVGKFKIQFARMGEPALNPAVIDVLAEIQDRYDIPGFIPSVSTVAPAGSDRFFDCLLRLKTDRYAGRRFQLQFSIHTTDEKLRDEIIPVKKWDFSRIARYAQRFEENGGQKVALNFALAAGSPVDVGVLARFFSPDRFLVKITPINPTYRAAYNKMVSYVDADDAARAYELVDALKSAGYDVILSIGEVEENRIGSNCGQYVMRHLMANNRPAHDTGTGYGYWENGGVVPVKT